MKEIKETQTTGRSLKKKGDRRAFLAAAAGAAAGATAATLLPRSTKPAGAAPGDPLYLGQWNDGEGLPTWLRASLKTAVPGDPNATLHLRNEAPDPGFNERAWALHAESTQSEAIFGITFGDPAVGGDPAGVHGLSGLPGPFTGEFGPGTGVHGTSGSGCGVRGHSQAGPGVEARSESGPGVVGQSDSGPGVRGVSNGVYPVEAPGVEGLSADGIGVRGRSDRLFGVEGFCENWIGVLGWTDNGLAGVVGIAPGEKPGVIAHSQPTGGPMPSDGGVALLVSGRARFSTAGASSIPARSAAVAVANPAVRAESHITVMFTSDPGGASVAWVERQPDTGFIVHLSGRARWPVPFTYLLVEPGT